jgi:hypothetical protein
MLAEAVPPVPPSVEVMFPVVLFAVPAATPVTPTENVHDEFALRLPPPKVTRLVPAVELIVAVQDPRFLVPSASNWAGNVSVKLMLVNPTLFGLVIVKLSNVEPFSGMLAAPKDLVRVGGATTVIEAFDVLPVPPLVEVT